MPEPFNEHRFIRAKKTLRFALSEASFSKVIPECLRCLDDPQLLTVHCLLDNASRRKFHRIFCLHACNCRTVLIRYFYKFMQ